MKKLNLSLILSVAIIISIFATSSFASIAGSTLTTATKYVPGKTNTLVYRCDAVTLDGEYMYTVAVNYLAGMNVITGELATGETYGGTFSYDGAVGDAAIARWDSDENLGTGYGSLVNGESGYFSNEVIVSSALSGEQILTYYLFGDGYASAPHALTNTLTIQEWVPSVNFSPDNYSRKIGSDQTANYSLKLINDTGANDSFTLSYASSPWSETGPVNTETVAFEDSTNFTVSVQVPADALAGQISTTIVTAVGVTDNSFTGTATIITHCTWNNNLLDENFDSNPFENGWIQYNLGAPTGWVWDTTSGDPPPCMKHQTIPQPCTNWLVTPGINLDGNYISANLTFEECYHNSDTNLFPYKYAGLWISTNQQNPTAGTYFELQEFGSHYGSWAGSEWDIDLLDYIGLTDVYFAFLYIGSNAANHYLDNVKLQTIKTGIDNVALDSPATIAIESYSNTPNITASLFINGETGTSGPAANITAQIGYGIRGTTPDATWTWISAPYAHSDATKDYFVTNGFVTVSGDFDYACRFKKGEANWVYGDLNGSTNGYSSDAAGKMTANMQPVQGDLIYEQTLSTALIGGIFSYAITNSSNSMLIVADDITPNAGSTIKSIRWQGSYDGRDGLEKGFSLFIYTNAPADETVLYDHPGGAVYTEYFPGYRCEQVVTEDLRKYTLDLATPFYMESGIKHWFALQQLTDGSSRWASEPTPDAIRGLELEIKGAPYGLTNWISETDIGLEAADLGVELYGEKNANVYLSPLEQTKTGNPGKLVSFPLTVKNQTDVTNTYKLNYQGTWLVTGPADSGIMIPGENNEISVDIAIPGNALEGQIVTSVVTAIGITDPSFTNSAVIITECTWQHKLSCENFDGAWPPVGWTNFIMSDVAGWTNSSPGADDSGSCAFHNDDNMECDDWLITALDLTSNAFNSFIISFQNKISYPSYYAASEVMVSTGSINPADGDYVSLLDVGNTDTDWTKREVDLFSYTGSNVYLAFRYTGDYMHEWFVDDVCLAGIITPPSGILDGTVSDAHSGLPIENATINIDSGAFVLTTDSNGYYSQSLPTNSYTITVSSANYVPQTVANVDIIDSATTTLNFNLVGSIFGYSPSNIFETMYLGNVVTNTITVTNSGPFDVDFSIVNIPIQNVDCYGVDINSESTVFWNTATPGTVNTIGTTTDDIYGGDFLDDNFNTLYGITAGGNLVTVNVSNGSITVVGALNLQTGDIPTDLSQDPTDGTLYACATDMSVSRLYTINPLTGAATLIGAINNANFALSIAVNTAGEMFCLDGSGDNLLSINKSTADGTIIGSLGYDANYAQGMDFNHKNGILYIAAYNATVSLPQLRIADVNTGNSTNLGTLGDGSGNISTIAIATKKRWTTTSINAGSVAAGTISTFDVIFDANLVSNPGIYSAELSFRGNFVNELQPMPLAMSILSPKISVAPTTIDFGQIEIDTVTQEIITVKNVGTDLLTVNVAITNCLPTAGWLAANWDSANIATGDVNYLEVIADTTGFLEGNYTCEVWFASNDPNSPDIYVPVSMEIIPEPVLFIIYYLSFLIFYLKRK